MKKGGKMATRARSAPLDLAFSEEEALGNAEFFKEHGYENVRVSQNKENREAGTFMIWGRKRQRS